MGKMSNHDRACLAAKAMHASRTPEQRKQAASHAYLAAAVGAVCKRWDELTGAQREAIHHVVSS